MNYKPEELATYLYDYCNNLLTVEEREAYKNTLVLFKIRNSESPAKKKLLRKEWFSSDAEVLDLLKNGEEEFFRNLELRVLRDNPQKEFLNICPKCNYLTKTPKAKQCRKCHHSWHNKVER